FRYVGAAPHRSARGRLAGDKLDFTSDLSRDPARDVGDGDFFHGPDVIDAEMLSFFFFKQKTAYEIVDETEAARFLTGALDFETQRPGGLRSRGLVQSQRELGDNMLPAHVGSVDVVWAKDQ